MGRTPGALIESAYGRLAGFLGGNPRQVLLLRRWFARSAQGAIDLNYERRHGSALNLDMRMIFGFLLVVQFCASIMLAALIAFLSPAMGVWGIPFAHGFSLIVILVPTATSTLFDDHDLHTIGWWPISRRDVTLARMGLLATPALAVSFAMTAVPLLTFLFVGRPPLLAGIGLFVGIALQTVLFVGATIALAAILMRKSRKRAKVIFQWIGSSMLMLPGLWSFVAKNVPEAWKAWVSEWRLLLPFGWAASWASWSHDPKAWLGMATGTTVTFAVVRSLRPLLLGHRGETIRPRSSRRSSLPLVRLVELLLAPATPGREGRVVRRMLATHLRDDPSTGATFAIAPLLLVVQGLVAYFEPEVGQGFVAPVPPLPFRMSFVLLLGAMMLPLMSIPTLVYSACAPAAWVVALGDLDGRKLLAAQRGVARALTLVPFLVGTATIYVKAGASLPVLLGDLVLVALTWEAGAAAAQKLYPVFPFSRPREGGGTELIPAGVLILPIWIMASVWVATGYELLPFGSGKLITWLALIALIRRSRRELFAETGRTLPLEIAPPVRT